MGYYQAAPDEIATLLNPKCFGERIRSIKHQLEELELLLSMQLLQLI
jgi:hypothetical protein